MVSGCNRLKNSPLLVKKSCYDKAAGIDRFLVKEMNGVYGNSDLGGEFLPAGCEVVAIFDFAGNSTEDLSFSKGDFLTVIAPTQVNHHFCPPLPPNTRKLLFALPLSPPPPPNTSKTKF